jgi:hypothetical protein
MTMTTMEGRPLMSDEPQTTPQPRPDDTDKWMFKPPVGFTPVQKANMPALANFLQALQEEQCLGDLRLVVAQTARAAKLLGDMEHRHFAVLGMPEQEAAAAALAEHLEALTQTFLAVVQRTSARGNRYADLVRKALGTLNP